MLELHIFNKYAAGVENKSRYTDQISEFSKTFKKEVYHLFMFESFLASIDLGFMTKIACHVCQRQLFLAFSTVLSSRPSTEEGKLTVLSFLYPSLDGCLQMQKGMDEHFGKSQPRKS